MIFDFSRVPDELIGTPQWVGWDMVNGRKIPVRGGRAVSQADSRSDHESTVARATREGIKVGFSFDDGDPYVGIDFDSCRDAKTGEFDAWVRPWLEEFAGKAYIDISPSGTGVKVICRASSWPDTAANSVDVPGISRGGKRPGIEVYKGRRYFAITGDVPAGFECHDLSSCDDVLMGMILEYPFERAAGAPREGSELDDRKPGDDFNIRGMDAIIQLLIQHGWKVHGDDQHGHHQLTRPGKEGGCSATLGLESAQGRRMMHCFTSNADPFAAGESYSLFRVYSLLECDGRDSIAASDLLQQGWGRGYLDEDDEVEAEMSGEEPSEEAPKKRRHELTQNAKVLFAEYVGRLERGEGDVLYQLPHPLSAIEVGPGLISIIGAPPGKGKTALTMQLLFEALTSHTDLRAVVCNAEMDWETLSRRELTRRTRIDPRALRFATLTEEEMVEVRDTARDMEPLMERIEVMLPTFDPRRLAKLALVHKPGLLIVDYLQKFSPPGVELRQGTGDVCAVMRDLAREGWAVLALSATSRSAKGGHDTRSLSLASFKESGEIEYNADAAYLLVDGDEETDDNSKQSVVIRCEKNRNGERSETPAIFDMAAMSFELGFEPIPGAVDGVTAAAAANDFNWNTDDAF